MATSRKHTEFVTADFEPDIDPAQFRPPPGSLRAESFGEAMGGGGLAWRATKTAAGLAAGGLGALIKYGPRPPDRRAPEDGIDIEPAIPVQDPALLRCWLTGLPMGAWVSDDLLNLLHAGGPGAFTATMHHWMDPSALASRVPESARRAGFGGLGYLMDALGERDGAVRMTSTCRIAGPGQYQIDRSHQPRHGPVTIACDGQRCWKVYADKITTGPAEPPPSEIGELVDPSWLLQCWLADGTSVLASGRPAYRISVTRRHDYPWHSFFMVFPVAVAVIDAELGVVVRLTSYSGGKPVWKYELQDLARVSADFKIDVPADLPVSEAGPFDDIRNARPPHPPSLPVTLGKIVARHAATEAARAARNLLGRLGPRDPA